MEQTSWTWRSLRNQCRTPAGLLAVLGAVTLWIIELLDKTQQVSEHLPKILRFLASPLAIPIILIAGVMLIWWEVHDIHQTGEGVSKLSLRHHLLNSALAAGVLVMLAAIVVSIGTYLRRNPSISQNTQPLTKAPESPYPQDTKPTAPPNQDTGKPKHALTRKSEHEEPAPKPPIQLAPGGINIGRDNNGSATVINNSSPDRHLNESAIAQITELAKSLPDDSAEWLAVESIGTPESSNYAFEIHKLFHDQSKTGDLITDIGQVAPVPSGVLVLIHDGESDPRFDIAQRIATGLMTAGVQNVTFSSAANVVGQNKVKILVGTN